MLKSWLGIYYLAVPASAVPIPLAIQLNYLRVLVTLVDTMVFDDECWQPYPAYILLDLLPPIHTYLRRKLLQDSASCYSRDSMIYKSDNRVVADDFIREELSWKAKIKRGFSEKYNTAKVREEGEDKFVTSMNELLEWAGIEARSKEELLS